MSITHKDGLTTIECDKCHTTSEAHSGHYNDVFFDEGWALHRGRKYMHLCRKCLSPKARRAMDFVKEKFGL